jgi:hypothetical protein
VVIPSQHRFNSPPELDETGESPWLGKFGLDHPVNTPEKYTEEEKRGWVFSVEVELTRVHLAPSDKDYSVCISCRRKSEI